jgi:hypothetical protein
MLKPCSERDRLREAYYQATLEASRLNDDLESLPFGPEFSAALDKAEDAHLACLAALRGYEDHCAAHGCEVLISGLTSTTFALHCGHQSV